MKLFHILLGVTTLVSFFNGTTSAFTTSGILIAVQSSPRETAIGRQKYVGPAGFALAGFLSGVAIDYFPSLHITCYAGMFINYAVTTIGLGTAFHFLFKNNHVGHVDGSQGVDVNRIVLCALKSFETWFFFAIILFHGIALGLVFSFSFIYLTELHATHSLMGLSMVVNGISAGLTFLVAQNIIHFLGGPIGGMTLSYFFWFIRCLCLFSMKNPYVILGINVINGITTSLFVVCYMEYIKNKFPRAIYTAMSGIVISLYNNGGSFISFVVGGKMYKDYGGKKLFISCSVGCAIWTIIVLIYSIIDKFRNRHSSRLKY